MLKNIKYHYIKRAGNEIILSDGFIAEEGSVFHAEVGIDICDPNNRQSVFMPSNTQIQVEPISCNQFLARMSANSTETDYFWTLTGENVETNYLGNEIQIDNLQAGQYTLYCTIDSGGTAIDSKIIKVHCPENNSVKTPTVKNTEPDISPQFYVYPNPTNAIVNIIPEHLAANEEYIVVVSNIFGKTLVLVKSNSTLIIDLSMFTPGVYLLNIKTQNYEKLVISY
ncbi:MAG: T9SS type A sorting domain-containing protein [Bacteroidales bacterium]|nr:T9SS type A sorting domain-containing protein [Bacteroidales bacterium]